MSAGGLIDGLEVGVGHALGGVAHHQRHVAALSGLERPDLGVVFDVVAHAAALAKSRGVGEHHPGVRHLVQSAGGAAMSAFSRVANAAFASGPSVRYSTHSRSARSGSGALADRSRCSMESRMTASRTNLLTVITPANNDVRTKCAKKVLASVAGASYWPAGWGGRFAWADDEE